MSKNQGNVQKQSQPDNAVADPSKDLVATAGQGQESGNQQSGKQQSGSQQAGRQQSGSQQSGSQQSGQQGSQQSSGAFNRQNAQAGKLAGQEGNR